MFTTIYSNPFFKKSSKPLEGGDISTFGIGTDVEEFPGQEGPSRPREHHQRWRSDSRLVSEIVNSFHSNYWWKIHFKRQIESLVGQKTKGFWFFFRCVQHLKSLMLGIKERFLSLLTLTKQQQIRQNGAKTLQHVALPGDRKRAREQELSYKTLTMPDPLHNQPARQVPLSGDLLITGSGQARLRFSGYERERIVPSETPFPLIKQGSISPKEVGWWTYLQQELSRIAGAGQSRDQVTKLPGSDFSNTVGPASALQQLGQLNKAWVQDGFQNLGENILSTLVSSPALGTALFSVISKHCLALTPADRS